MQTPIISFDHFNFKYDAQAEKTLDDICLNIYPGEKVLIAGPSGSGKSTIANCINGLIPFSYPGESTGSLTVDGLVAKNESIFSLSKHVGTVLQDPDGQFIGLTVGEDIAFSLENDCVPQSEMIDKVNMVSELVDVDAQLNHAPFELSGGQKQRVSLAGVMVDDVKILLFDEPLANLDPAAGKNTIDLIDKIKKATDTTVIIIEHRLEDVLYRDVDRIILMGEGRILADMKPDELLTTKLLTDNGIREPLYITALKYAGVDIREDMNPASIDKLSLNEADMEKVRIWYKESKRDTALPQRKELLKLNDINFAYDNKGYQLSNVSFKIDEGECISIVGKNGAGKSTLSKLICGFETPLSGEITLSGENLLTDTIKERAKKIGYVMQNPNQMISKPMIFDEVAFAPRMSGFDEEKVKEMVYDTLKICGLYEFRNWPVSALSFGQKKRVTIASVLVMQPKIIILDEPTAGQDFKHYTDIMEFLLELNKKGYTVIMVTHDMHLMLEYTDRALVFADGKMIADKSSAEVLCDEELIRAASLKETSLFELANLCGIDEPVNFVKSFISYDREERENGKS